MTTAILTPDLVAAISRVNAKDILIFRCHFRANLKMSQLMRRLRIPDLRFRFHAATIRSQLLLKQARRLTGKP